MKKKRSNATKKCIKPTSATYTAAQAVQVKPHEQRKNKEINGVSTESDQSRLIAGSFSSIYPVKIDPECSLLLDHKTKDCFGVDVDVEANLNGSYGAIFNDNLNTNNNYSNWISSFTPIQRRLIIATLTLLVIVTLILLPLRNTEQLTFIWGKIFC